MDTRLCSPGRLFEALLLFALMLFALGGCCARNWRSKQIVEHVHIHDVVRHGNRLVACGDEKGVTFPRAVWVSDDDGDSWVAVANLPTQGQEYCFRSIESRKGVLYMGGHVPDTAGNVRGVLWSSPDGLTWSEVFVSPTSAIVDIAVGKAPSEILVAVGGDSWSEPPTGQYIWMSSDGVTWKSLALPSGTTYAARFLSVTRADLEGEFLALDEAQRVLSISILGLRTSGLFPSPRLLWYPSSYIFSCDDNNTVPVGTLGCGIPMLNRIQYLPKFDGFFILGAGIPLFYLSATDMSLSFVDVSPVCLPLRPGEYLDLTSMSRDGRLAAGDISDTAGASCFRVSDPHEIWYSCHVGKTQHSGQSGPIFSEVVEHFVGSDGIERFLLVGGWESGLGTTFLVNKQD